MNGVYAYFAYGSNLLPERLFQRCPTAVAYASAILPNYRLTERLYADVDGENFSPQKYVNGCNCIFSLGISKNSFNNFAEIPH